MLSGAHTNDALLAVEREISPREARHWNGILLNEPLFRRIDALWQRRDTLGLNAEQARVLERYYLMFKRAGAALDAEARKRLAEISERLATLGTTFSQNVLADEQAYTLVLESEDDLAGLPDFVRQAAGAAATERGLAGKHVITLSRSSVEPFLQFSGRRELREKIFRAWIARGDGGGKTDNKAIIAEILALRAERARLLGYQSFSHYKLDDAMAKTPQAVRDSSGCEARVRARFVDRDAMQALIQEEGGNFKLALGLALLRREAAQAPVRHRRARSSPTSSSTTSSRPRSTQHKLFGLSFERRRDIPGWHPDVEAWEVRDADGKHRGLFFGDYFARSSKHAAPG